MITKSIITLSKSPIFNYAKVRRMQQDKGFAKRLAYLLAEREITPSSFAKLIELSQGLISQYLSGDKVPREKNMRKIALYFHVRPAWLQYGEGNKESEVIIAPQKGSAVPVLERHQVKKWLVHPVITNEYRAISMFFSDKFSPEVFVIEVKGDSMESPTNPRGSYYEGDFLVIDPKKEPKPGHKVFVDLGNDDLIIRRLIEEGNKKVLVAANPKYPNILVDKHVKIIGVVIQKCVVEPLIV